VAGFRVASKINWNAEKDALQKAAEVGLELGMQKILADVKTGFASGKGSDGTDLKGYAKGKKGKPGAYAKKRLATGRQIGFVELRYTGALLRSLVTKVTSLGTKMIGVVYTPSHGNVINGISKDRPNAFRMTDKMIDTVRKFINENRK